MAVRLIITFALAAGNDCYFLIFGNGTASKLQIDKEEKKERETHKQKQEQKQRNKKGMSPVMLMWNWKYWCERNIYG